MELVTLEHPDGRRYRTDSPSEVNLLVGSYGYRRVDQGQKSQNAAGKRAPKSASSAPPAAPEAPESGEAPSS